MSALKAAGFQGFYYLQCPKIGALCWEGSKRPFQHYQVSPDWVLTLLQPGKMRFHDARGELVKCIKRLPSTLQTVEMWAQEVKTTGLHEHV